jgi:hypothetical protein
MPNAPGISRRADRCYSHHGYETYLRYDKYDNTIATSMFASHVGYDDEAYAEHSRTATNS